MSILNNECPICTEDFKNSDDIYSTSCGHIFHYVCMNEWQRNGTSCPQCRHYNPTTHKLYLRFDEKEPQNPEIIKELELKLKSSNEKNAQLLDQMNEIEFNFLKIQEQFTLSEQEKKILEERIRQMNDSEQNFLHLQGQYTESSEFIKHLQDQIRELLSKKECSEELSQGLSSFENKIRELSIQNERLTKELRLKNVEIESLKNNLDEEQSTTSSSIESGRIKILEQKLKYISTELEKEIANSTRLSIENLKLQSYIDLKSVEKIEKTSQKETIKNSNSSENRNKGNKKSCAKTNSNEEKNNNTSTKIFIKDLPWNQLTVPLVNIVVKLASKMNFMISPDDIVQVKIVNKDKPMSSTGQLMVEFKNIQLRNEFMSNKMVLKNDPTTRSIIIGDYIDDEMHSLLMYAKEKLRNNGYNHVFYKNNKIFAKKHRTHPKIIPILDRAHVDTLRSKNQSVQLNTNDTIEITKSKVDENFYQL